MVGAAKPAGAKGILPLHQRILAELEQKIISGEWAPGHRIPFEVDLARHYGCSRVTVARALHQLGLRGLIERRRKSGTFVMQPLSQSAMLEIHDVRSEVESLGLAYSYRRLTRVRRSATATDCRWLGIDVAIPLVEVTCCHHAGRRPFCFERRLINLATVPSAADESFEEIAPGPWLLEKVPWTAAEHTIRAVPADARAAEMLAIRVGEACLSMERRTWSSGAAVTYVRLVYPGNSHWLVARFEPSHGNASAMRTAP